MKSNAGAMLLTRKARTSLNETPNAGDDEDHTERQDHLEASSVPYVHADVTLRATDAQNEADMVAAIASLSPSMRDALTVDMMDHRPMTGAERIAKMRAVSKLRAELT